MRVQLWPFDYVFRKGSSLRLWIDAPTGETGGWSFNSRPGIPARWPRRGTGATCNTVLNQSCRSSQIAVPAGTLTAG
jgi:hypothetical protein